MLYHKEVYWKDWFDNSAKELVNSNLMLSKHMSDHLDNPNYKHDIDIKQLYLIVKELQNNLFVTPFEVEVENNKVTKCVVRTKYNDNKDITIVFRKGLIVTAYLNYSCDKHSSLNHEKYEKGNKYGKR